MKTILPVEFNNHVHPPGNPGDIILLSLPPDPSPIVCLNCGQSKPGQFVAWSVTSRHGSGNVRPKMKWFGEKWTFGQMVVADCPVCAGDSRKMFLEINSGLQDMVLQSGVRAVDCDLFGFVERPGTERALEVARFLLHDVTNDRSVRSATFTGHYGTGKTHLLCAILNGCRLSGIYSRYTTAEGILSDLRATFNRETARKSTERVVSDYCRVPVLAVDELPRIQTGSEWVATKLFDIMSRRLTSNVLTLVSSNKRLDELTVDPLGAIASRLSAGYVCEISSPDIRPAIGQMLVEKGD